MALRPVGAYRRDGFLLGQNFAAATSTAGCLDQSTLPQEQQPNIIMAESVFSRDSLNCKL
jgi:hypothetical protein